MSSLKQLKVVKSSISGRVVVVMSCSAMLMMLTMSRMMLWSEVVFNLTELCHDEWCHIEWSSMLNGAMLAREGNLIKTT